jgi:hypothetical protein
MIQKISDKLKILLDTLKWNNKPFVNVIDYHTLENTWYPYLCFECIEFNANILDNCNNIRTYIFEILIFQEITKSWWRQEATKIIYKSLNDVINLVDINFTLWLSEVKMTNPIFWRIEPFTMQNWKSLVWRLLLEVQTYNVIK